MHTKSSNDGQRTKWRSLTMQWLTLIVFPLTLLVLVLTIGSTTLHQNAMRDMVGERDERVVQMAAHAVEDQITARENAIHGLALQVPVVSESRKLAVDEYQRLLDRSAYLETLFDLGLLIVNTNGDLVAAQGSWVNMMQDEREILLEGMLALRKAPSTQLPVFVSSALSVPGSEKLGGIILALSPDQEYVVGGAFSIDTLVDRALSGAFSPESTVSVLMLDQNKQVLYRKGFNAAQESLLMHPGVPESLAGKTGRTYTTVQAGEHVVAFTSVDRMNWGLLIEEHWEQVASPLLEATHLAPLAMIPVLLLAFFVFTLEWPV